LGGYEPRGGDPHRPLIATLIAHGTNLGLAAMAQCVDAVTAERLQDTSRWFLREATLLTMGRLIPCCATPSTWPSSRSSGTNSSASPLRSKIASPRPMSSCNA